MRTVCLILVIFLAGCGRFYPPTVINKDFLPYVQSFEDLWGHKVKFSVIYGDVPDEYIGVCKTWSDGHKEVHIDKEWWESEYTNDTERLVLIYHELGHCALGRGHLDGFTGGKPTSIMNSYNIGGWYDSNEDYYDFELFNPGQGLERHEGCVLKMD